MNVKKSLAGIALASVALVGTAFAEEAVAETESADDCAIGAYAGTQIKNGYLSNGYLFADEWVLQSYAGITFGGFDLNIWNCWGTEDGSYANSPASEIDYELDYGFSVDDFDFGLGVAAWVYPNTGDSFDEWVGKASIAYNGFYLRNEVNARFGLEGQQGCYGQYKLSKGFELADNLSFDAYGLIAYASKNYREGKGVDKAGFVDAEFGASVSYSLCDNASVSVGCQYSVVVDGDLRDVTSKQCDGDMEHFIYFAGLDVSL